MYVCMNLRVCSCKFIMLIFLNNGGAYHVYKYCKCVFHSDFSECVLG